MLRSCLCLLIVTVVESSAHFAKAQDATSPKVESGVQQATYLQPSQNTAVEPADGPVAKANIQELVIGDIYFIEAERGQVKEQVSGTLVKITDNWIVLHQSTEARSEQGVPVLSNVPYAGRLFRNVGIGRSDQHTWIPRKAATVRGRVLNSDNGELKVPLVNEPPSDMPCTIVRIQDGEVMHQRFSISGLSDDQVVLERHELRETQVEPSGLGRIPLLGAAFRRTEFQEVKSTERLMLDKVLCIVTSCDVDARK
jgi:hypothetical protein